MTDTLLDLDQVDAAIADALGDAYDCQRVWSAWGIGTMGEEDFVRVVPERIAEIREAALGPVRSELDRLRGECAQARAGAATLHEALSAAMIYVCAHADDATIVLCGDALYGAKAPASGEATVVATAVAAK